MVPETEIMKPKPWSASVLQALLAAAFVFALLVLPGTPAFRRIAERLIMFDTQGRDLLRPVHTRPSSQQPAPSSGAVLAPPALPPPLLPPPLPPPFQAPRPPQQKQPPSHCDLSIGHSVFADSCTHLEDVCVDQGRLILYGRQYRPEHGNGAPQNLPDLTPSKRSSKAHFPYWQKDSKDINTHLPPIYARPASSREPRQYLAQPSFSNCTVPVVFYQHNSFNYAHVLRDNAARMWSALAETPWADHVRLVLMTPGGLPISPLVRDLWQPLSNLRVTSWAEFSVRLPDGQVGPDAPQHAAASGGSAKFPPSYEGSELRCFRHMYVCLDDVYPRRIQLHAYGQHLARYYGAQQLLRETPEVWPPLAIAAAAQQQQKQKQKQQQRARQPGGGEAKAQQQQQRQRAPELPPPESILKQLGRERGRGEQAAAAGVAHHHQLRVVFSKRSSWDRQLLNAAELLDRCNRWRYTTAAGAKVSALCWEAETPTLAAGIAMAQLADVLIGAHGANLANAFMMRPGSAAIELTMFGFEDISPNTAPHTNFARRNFGDADTQLQWWKILLCDQGSWKPGLKEARAMRAGTAIAKDAAKYRHLIVRWEAIQTVLEAALDTAGDMAAYRARYEAGQWWWLSTNSSTVYAGPDIYQTCSKARKQGLID